MATVTIIQQPSRPIYFITYISATGTKWIDRVAAWSAEEAAELFCDVESFFGKTPDVIAVSRVNPSSVSLGYTDAEDAEIDLF